MFKLEKSIKSLIDQDVRDGGTRAMTKLLDTIKNRSGSAANIFEEIKKDIVQIDVPTKRGATRIHLQQVPESGVSCFSLWDINDQGEATGNTFDLMSYRDDNKNRRTVLSGSSINSSDGCDLEISPRQIARKVDSAMKNLRKNGFQIA